MLRKLKLILPLIVLLSLAAVVNLASASLIRIDPALPVMTESPATFSVYLQSGDDATTPHIFLVMTEECFNGLTGSVTVDWPGGSTPDLTILAADWNLDSNGGKVPLGADSGTGYTVSSLKSHLGTTDGVYWVFKPFLAGPITETPKSFTVNLPSTKPRMLVYALGKSGDTSLFNNRVPPTLPGFVVPEAAPLIAMGMSFAAVGLYAIKRRKN